MAFNRINTQDQNLELIQSNISNALTPLQSNPMNGGNILNSISLTSGQDNLVEHGLNRTPKIFFIGNLHVNSVVWSPVTSSLSGSSVSTKYINLRCSTSCTVSVWIN